MFYFFSKIIYLLLAPLVWGLLLIGAGLFISRKPSGNKLIFSGLALLYVFSNAFVFQVVIGKWEKPSEKIPEGYRTAVVLGGLASWNKKDSCIVFGEAADRYLQGILLVHNKKVDRIVFSGGNTREEEIQREAFILKDYAKNTGISDSLLMVENRSANTYENALYTSQLFSQHVLPKKIVLVTSAFHMFRAAKCFEKQGFDVVAHNSHPLKKTQALKPGEYWFPKPEILYHWNLLLKEWAGILVYRVAGYI